MKILKNFKEISEFTGCNADEFNTALLKALGRTYIIINEYKLNLINDNGELIYIYINENDKKDCEDYFMQYEKDCYECMVYVDDLEKWQKCEIANVINDKLRIIRATVLCKTGTQLNRVTKFIKDKKDIKADGCIYLYEN